MLTVEISQLPKLCFFSYDVKGCNLYLFLLFLCFCFVLNRCRTLEQAPFTACHKHINPKSFIDACSRTLCKYPAVDGLRCQFFEAYAAACSRHSNIPLEGWKVSSGCCKDIPLYLVYLFYVCTFENKKANLIACLSFICLLVASVVQAQCQDLSCSSHEFCGENSLSRETQCLCRAIFASKYRSAGTFGEPLLFFFASKVVTESKKIFHPYTSEAALKSCYIFHVNVLVARP